MTNTQLTSTQLTSTQFRKLFDEANAAGVAAAERARPTPMVVVEHANPFDDASPIVRQYAPVMDGVCGFAWVNVKPGTSKFARWLKDNGIARTDSYYGGVTIWISDYGQSYERKIAHASAMARVLSEQGIKAYSSGRLD